MPRKNLSDLIGAGIIGWSLKQFREGLTLEQVQAAAMAAFTGYYPQSINAGVARAWRALSAAEEQSALPTGQTLPASEVPQIPSASIGYHYWVNVDFSDPESGRIVSRKIDIIWPSQLTTADIEDMAKSIFLSRFIGTMGLAPPVAPRADLGELTVTVLYVYRGA